MAAQLLSRERKAAWLGWLGGAIVVVLLGQLLLGTALSRWSYDLPFRWSRQNAPDDLVMVYLDSKVKVRLGESADQPLNRRYYAQLLDRLTREGARLVLFDILFDSPRPDSDAAFAEAMRRHGKVVLVNEYVEQWQGDSFTTSLLPSTPLLADAAAGSGLANVPIDPDNEVRVLSAGIEDFPSVSWVAASLLGANATREPQARSTWRWLNYYCEPSVLRAVNLDHALETNGLPAGFFHDKIVVVGSRREGGVAGAARDEFRTPYSFSLRKGTHFEEPLAPGAVIHAFALLNLVRGDWLTRLDAGQERVLVLIWGILISVALLNLRPWLAAPAALLAFGGITSIAWWLHSRHHVWFSWLTPAAVQTATALVWSISFQYAVELRRRRRLRRAFAVYLSPHMADRIANSDFDLSLGGKEVEATIMFTDLEGFARIAETMPPAEISRLLTSYFSETSREILEQDGTIIKYVGDAVMAVWGAPLADPRPAQRAVITALGIRRSGLRDIAGRRLHTRIGINSGTVLAGNLGSEFRFDYTLIGEATNTASRLEGLNKHLGTDILISDSTRREVDDKVVVRGLGRFILAGTTRPTEVFEVVGLVADLQPPPGWLETFAQGLAHFAKRELDPAEAAFRSVLAQRSGQDGPSQFFLNEIARARATPESVATWDGSVRLEAK